MSTPSNDPVSPGQVFRAGLAEIFWAPVTWVPLIPSMGVVSLLSLPWWANTALIAAPVVFVASHWTRSWPRLANVIRGKLLLEQKQSEDADLTSLVKTMSHHHQAAEARVLISAKIVLDEISSVNAEGTPMAQALRIEAVARDIYNQMLAKARSLSSQPDEECLPNFQKSLKTMEDSLALLKRQAEVLKGMSQLPEEDRLAHLEETLRTENTIANQIIDRVQGDTKLSE